MSESKFTLRNLYVLAYSGGFTQWVYKAPTLRVFEVMAPRFFDSVADMIAPGDMIMVTGAADGGAILYVSASNDAVGVLTVPLAETKGGA